MAVFKPHIQNSEVDFSDVIMESLRSNLDDYIFKFSDLNKIINKCEKENISLLYECNYNKNNHTDLEYIHVIPVKFYTDIAGNDTYQLNIKDLPNNWHWRKLPSKK